jgi:hypothetical protein
MKRSELKEFIKGEILSSLSEASPEDVNNQKELNKELEKTSKLSKEIGLEETARTYWHIIEDVDGEKGHQGVYNTKEEAEKRADSLQDMFPRSFFYVEASNSRKEPVDITLEEANIGLANIEEMGYEAGEEAFENIKSRFKNKPDHQAYRKGFFQGYIDNAGSYGLNEDVDDVDDDKDAIAQANAARGKHKKLDIAVKALKDITTEMKSLARDYSKADGAEKEKIKDQLKIKTPKKKELEALVAKLEKNVI